MIRKSSDASLLRRGLSGRHLFVASVRSASSSKSHKSRTARPPASREPGFQKKVLPSPHLAAPEYVRCRDGGARDHDEQDPEPDARVRAHGLGRGAGRGPRVRARLVPVIGPASRVLVPGALVVRVVVVRLVVVLAARSGVPAVVVGIPWVVGVSVVVVSVAVVLAVRRGDHGGMAQRYGVSLGALSAVEGRPCAGGGQP